MSDSTRSTTETGATHGDVEVQRELERKAGGMVGRLHIETETDGPVTVQIHDEFPAGLPVGEVGFSPEHEPGDGEISPEGATITQFVGADPVVIEYGLKLTEPVADASFAPPVIRDVEPASTGGRVPVADGGKQSSTSVETSTGQTESSQSLSSVIPTPGEEQSDGEQSDHGQTNGDEAVEQHTIEPTDQREAATSGEASSRAIERAVEDVDAPASDTDEPGDYPDGESPPADDEIDLSGIGDDVAAGPETESADTAAVSATTPDTDEREEAASAARSVQLRIDQLSARVEEFATYATALEELIDTHGTGPDIVTQVERELGDIERRIDTIREEMEAANDRSSSAVVDLRDRTTAIEEDLEEIRDTLDSETDTLHEHVDTEVARLDSAIAVQETDVDDVRDDADAIDDRVAVVETDVQSVRETVLEVQAEFAAVSDDVAAMTEELEALRSEVEEIAEVRESLATVFEPSTTTDAERDG